MSRRRPFNGHVRLLFVMTVTAGAACTDAAISEPSASVASEQQSGSIYSLIVDPLPIPAAIAITPANGTVYKERSGNLEITFSGFTTSPGTKVDVQVLADPDVIAEAGWETVATTTSEATQTFFNDPTSPIHRWSVKAVPTTSATPARWRRGGLLRYRTVAVDAAGKRTLLPFFDDRSGDCVDKVKTESWKTVLASCRSAYSPELGAIPGGTARSAALVSVTDDFDPDSIGGFGNTPPYLNRKGRITPGETDAYYAKINAPRSLDDFKRRFGFRNRNDEVEAKYYNLADLGIGREMHCRSFESRKGPSTACYVKNYGVDANNLPDFNRNIGRAFDDLIAGRNHFATVAMVKYGNAVAATPDGNDVQFFVYDALDVLANEAQLDSTGQNKSIPTNCLNCHGGRYDRTRRSLKDAVFLPFDPNGFLFSRRRESATYEAQADAFRQLNVIVKRSGPPAPVVQFIDGTYGDKVDVPGTPANLDWIAKGWDTTLEARTAYREVIKPYCRTCHISQTDQFAFTRIEDFKSTAALSVKTLCGNKEMPNAEATIGLFFKGSGRAHLVNALGVPGGCTPDRKR